MSLGPLDGPYPARARSVEGTISDHTPTGGELRDDELLHDAGIDTGLPFAVKAAIGVVAVVVLVMLLAGFLLF
jgi:hypothetical protein